MFRDPINKQFSPVRVIFISKLPRIFLNFSALLPKVVRAPKSPFYSSVWATFLAFPLANGENSSL